MQAVLKVERQVIGWFEVLDERCCRRESFPVGIIDSDFGDYYYFPVFEEPGMKIGLFHHLKEVVKDPAAYDRNITAKDEQVHFQMPCDMSSQSTLNALHHGFIAFPRGSSSGKIDQVKSAVDHVKVCQSPESIQAALLKNVRAQSPVSPTFAKSLVAFIGRMKSDIKLGLASGKSKESVCSLDIFYKD